MRFNLPSKNLRFDETITRSILSILTYIEKRLQDEPRTVEYAVNMNTNVAGVTKEIVFCSTDNKFYGCTSGGPAGSVTWVAFN